LRTNRSLTSTLVAKADSQNSTVQKSPATPACGSEAVKLCDNKTTYVSERTNNSRRGSELTPTDIKNHPPNYVVAQVIGLITLDQQAL